MKTLHGGLLVVCILLKLVEAVPLASFYTFGSSAGDTTLHRNDDSYSSRISLSTAFPYFGTNRRAVYVRAVYVTLHMVLTGRMLTTTPISYEDCLRYDPAI